MRDEFTTRLREQAASLAAGVTPRPAAEVRRRGDQRRRRAAAASAVLAAAVLTAGGVSAYAAGGHLGHRGKAGPVTHSSPGPVHHSRGAPHAAGPGPLDDLTQVSCASARACWGAGTSYEHHPDGRALVERWDGTHWSRVSDPRLAGIAGLRSVSCPTTRECWAAVDDGLFSRRVLRWDGEAWSVNTFAVPAASHEMQLTAVSCASPGDCWAVGSAGTGQRVATLTEHWDGAHWSVVPSPDPPGAYASDLTGVSCTARTGCWAVGGWDAPHGSGGGTLAEHWDGSAWDLVATPGGHSGPVPDMFATGAPLYSGFGAALNGVSCPAGPACVAVGNGANSPHEPNPDPAGVSLGPSTALELHWNGSAWARPGAPAPPGAVTTDLLSVSCSGPSACMAVGFWTPHGGGTRALAQWWDGNAWHVVPTPSLTRAPAGDSLTSVSCPAASDCWATGSHGFGQYLLRWNGSRWSLQH